MKILVTGGAGFIGSNLANHFEAEGHSVTVLDNFLSGDFKNLVSFGGNVVTGGCEVDAARLGGPFEAILHQSAITGVVSPQTAAADSAATDQGRMMQYNVEGFRNVLAWAAAWKARVVWASSASVYGNGAPPNRETDAPNPLNIYAFSKLTCERMAARWHEQTQLPITALRYFNVYGPGEAHKGKLASMIYQLAQQMKAGKNPRIFKFGEQKRDFVYIDDVVAANRLALAASGPAAAGGVFNVATGRPGTFNEIVENLNKVLGTRLAPEYFDNPYAFTQDHTEADLTHSRQVLGYVPKFDLAAGIAAYHKSGAL